MHEPRDDIQELVRGARRVRELIWQDPHRPRYHLVPPEGFFNDPNGALFWRGRYHLFYLAREPIPHPRRLGEELWVAAWDHVSSRDLVHWIQHPPAIRPKPDGSTPMARGATPARGSSSRSSWTTMRGTATVRNRSGSSESRPIRDSAINGPASDTLSRQNLAHRSPRNKAFPCRCCVPKPLYCA